MDCGESGVMRIMQPDPSKPNVANSLHVPWSHIRYENCPTQNPLHLGKPKGIFLEENSFLHIRIIRSIFISQNSVSAEKKSRSNQNYHAWQLNCPHTLNLLASSFTFLHYLARALGVTLLVRFLCIWPFYHNTFKFCVMEQANWLKWALDITAEVKWKQRTTESRTAKKEMNRKEQSKIKPLRFQRRRWTYFTMSKYFTSIMASFFFFFFFFFRAGWGWGVGGGGDWYVL